MTDQIFTLFDSSINSHASRMTDQIFTLFDSSINSHACIKDDRPVREQSVHSTAATALTPYPPVM